MKDFHIVTDLKGNDIFEVQFTTFDYAKEELESLLGDNYETERNDYEIVEIIY